MDGACAACSRRYATKPRVLNRPQIGSASKALPFTIIVLAVVLMLLWDFVQTLRSSDGDTGR